MSLHKLDALYFAVESSFATDPSANGSGYAFVHAQDITVKLERKVIERPLQNNTITRNTHTMGGYKSTLTFKTEMRGTGTAAASTVAAIDGEVGKLLKAVFGTQDKDTGSLVSGSGSTTTTIDVTAGQGSQFSIGNLVGVGLSTGIEVRRITNIATDTLTVTPAFSGAPANGNTVYAADNFRLADSGHGTVSFVAKGDGREFCLTGCMGSVKFGGITADGRPMFDFNFMGDGWSETTKASLPAATDSYTNYAPTVVGSPCYISTSATGLTIAEFDLDLGNKIVEQPSTAGTNGRATYVVTGRDIKGKLKAFFNTTQLTSFKNATEVPILMQVGSTAGNIVAFAIPKAQFTASDLESINELLGQGLPFEVNSSGNSSITDLTLGLL